MLKYILVFLAGAFTGVMLLAMCIVGRKDD